MAKIVIAKDVEGHRTKALTALTLATSLRFSRHDKFPGIYARKIAEARSGQFDLLAKEAVIRGTTPEALAEAVLAKADFAVTREGEVELERVATKQAIQAATTRAEIFAAIKPYLDLAASEGCEVQGLYLLVGLNDPT